MYKLSDKQREFLQKIHKEQSDSMSGMSRKFNHGIAMIVESALSSGEYTESDQTHFTDMIKRYRIHLHQTGRNISLNRGDLVFNKAHIHRDTITVHDFKNSVLTIDIIRKADTITFRDNDSTKLILKNRYK